MAYQNSTTGMNAWGGGYQNPYLYTQQPSQVQNQNNEINWVQGIEGAKAWQLPPNSNVVLMDRDNDGIFYIKVSDNVGMCAIRTFSYIEITNRPPVEPQIDMSEYVKKSELQELIEKMLGGESK